MILLVVLMFHSAIVILIVRAARWVTPSAVRSSKPLVLMVLPTDTPLSSRKSASAPRTTAPPSRSAPAAKVRETPHTLAPTQSETVPSESSPPPTIDWQQEAELAAHDTIAAAEQDNRHRDLSALSPAQRAWVNENRFEPAPPGIHWTHPRVQVMSDGLPIIWINDHCVSVPVMMFMVFCKIGHIEPRGDLFDHMRDPSGPAVTH
jgi:hypothetical protein